MDSLKGLITGIFGGFITVALVYLVFNKNSNATGLVKEVFGGFSNTLAVSMGGNTKM